MGEAIMRDDVRIIGEGENVEQIAPFEYNFILDGKAVDDKPKPNIEELEDGTLIIEGYASDFGLDRENEAFEPGAFERGIKSFIETNAPLCYHHKRDVQLGEVTEARTDDHGLKIKARIDPTEPGTEMRNIWNRIKSGATKGLSVGGFFRRKLTPNGWRIHDVDLTEISVTPVPVNPRTTFAVVAGKAFDGVEIPRIPTEAEDVREEDEWAVAEAAAILSRVFEAIEKRGKKKSDSDGVTVTPL
jgi:HK97 family phage prohead protease